MNLVDSCGWLEYFADGVNAQFFAPIIEEVAQLIVPTLCLTEVFKKVLRERNEDMALQAVALMQQGRVVVLDAPIALQAAKIGVQSRLPLADSILLATAVHYDAVLWTQDADFVNIAGVQYRAKS